VAIAPGEKESVVTPAGLEIRITNVALDESLNDEQGRTTVKFTYESAPKPKDPESDADSDAGEQLTTVLCSLTPGKVIGVASFSFLLFHSMSVAQIEQATVDIILDSNEEFIFETVGKKSCPCLLPL
jgi:FK506-binding nuclear protein